MECHPEDDHDQKYYYQRADALPLRYSFQFVLAADALRRSVYGDGCRVCQLRRLLLFEISVRVLDVVLELPEYGDRDQHPEGGHGESGVKPISPLHKLRDDRREESAYVY